MYLIRECREKGSRGNCGQILHVAPGIFFNRKYVQLVLGQILHVAPGKLYNRKCYWSSVRLHFLVQVYFSLGNIVGARLDSTCCSRYTFQQDKYTVGNGLDSLRCSRYTFQYEICIVASWSQVRFFTLLQAYFSVRNIVRARLDFTCWSRYTFQQEICIVGAGLDSLRCSRYTFQQEMLLVLDQTPRVAPGLLFSRKYVYLVLGQIFHVLQVYFSLGNVIGARLDLHVLLQVYFLVGNM